MNTDAFAIGDHTTPTTLPLSSRATGPTADAAIAHTPQATAPDFVQPLHPRAVGGRPRPRGLRGGRRGGLRAYAGGGGGQHVVRVGALRATAPPHCGGGRPETWDLPWLWAAWALSRPLALCLSISDQ